MNVAVTNREGGIALVTIAGAIDLTTAPTLRDAIHGLLEAGARRIVVDLGSVVFCDSIGLGTFVYAHNHCSASGGALRLAAPSAFLAGLLHTVGLSGLIPVHETVGAALHACAPAV
jgi:anti-anti-sigma factor